MYELRILNGLHRGATLPLDEQAQTIGQSEDADVVLVDQGIADRHAVLTM
ncbi:MAG: FHA domain-containing protein, partial [Janthinobacterium lividum]